MLFFVLSHLEAEYICTYRGSYYPLVLHSSSIGLSVVEEFPIGFSLIRCDIK